MNNDISVNNNSMIRNRDKHQNNGWAVTLPKNHQHDLSLIKNRTTTMTQQQIHASTTMSITTSNIIHVIGCHSSCHRHGLLLVVLLLPMVECCNWRFFLLPCQLFLFPSPICQVAGTSHSTANAVATALTITTTLPLVLCCVVLQCAEILSRQRLHS